MNNLFKSSNSISEDQRLKIYYNVKTKYNKFLYCVGNVDAI